MRFPAVCGALVLAALLSIVNCMRPAPALASPESPVQARVRAPAFAEKDIFGKETASLEKYRGKVVLLNFWATWCPPCRKETPVLESLQKSYWKQLTVIGVSVYCSYADTEEFYRDFKIPYPMIYGSYELMGLYGKVASIPTTFLIDKKGQIAAKVVGSRSRDQYEEILRPLLSE